MFSEVIRLYNCIQQCPAHAILRTKGINFNIMHIKMSSDSDLTGTVMQP